jgi:hypothetical protein
MLFLDTVNLIFKVFIKSIFNIYFPLVIFILYFQSKRYAELEERVLGAPRASIWRRVINSGLYGLVAGFIGSMAALWIGISIDEISIMLIWPLALILLLFDPRFICFSYAGGIVAMISLLFGWPEAYVPGIIALVGILHLMESMLMLMDGDHDPLPMLVQNNRHEVIGAFAIQKFWPLPLAFLVYTDMIVVGQAVDMPSWWPLLKSASGAASFMLIPMIAALGYSDIAITQPVKDRVHASAFRLGLYSLTLLVLSYAASRYKIFAYIGAIAMPVLHELVIKYGVWVQQRGEPIFVAPKRGLMVLDVLPLSPAETMGLKAGDTILSVNGRDVNSEDMLNEILRDYPHFMWVDGIDIKGHTKSCEHRFYPDGISNLGAIIMPKRSAVFINMHDDNDPLKNIMNSSRLG